MKCKAWKEIKNIFCRGLRLNIDKFREASDGNTQSDKVIHFLVDLEKQLSAYLVSFVSDIS